MPNTKSTSPLSLSGAKKKAQVAYARRYKSWAATLFFRAIGMNCTFDKPDLSIRLHSPTENEVQQNIEKTSAWLKEWHRCSMQKNIEWTRPHWRIINESIPVAIRLNNPDEIASFVDRQTDWERCVKRMEVLAQYYKGSWMGKFSTVFDDDFSKKLQVIVGAIESLSEDEWNQVLQVVDWLIENPHVNCYIRQLGIRGVDTKWLTDNSAHKKVVWQLYSAFTGGFLDDRLLSPPKKLQVKFLDDALTLFGMREISAPIEELSHYEKSPQVVIICENLVSVLTFPDIPGGICVFGKGYSAAELCAVPWIANSHVYYWGDLDTHGFKILSIFRQHHPKTTSLMMDKETLLVHQDLWVVEPDVATGDFEEYLTPNEKEALGIIRGGETNIRLEQERIAWDYVLKEVEMIK